MNAEFKPVSFHLWDLFYGDAIRYPKRRLDTTHSHNHLTKRAWSYSQLDALRNICYLIQLCIAVWVHPESHKAGGGKFTSFPIQADEQYRVKACPLCVNCLH